MPLQIIRDDITKVATDAIVNAANPQLKEGSGVCGAIFAAAGAKQLQEECDQLKQCHVGKAVLTKGYALPAKYIIHTVGPIWKNGNYGEETRLRSCYRESLALALQQGCKSVAFPLISCGVYGFPKDRALRTAANAIGEYLQTNDMEVYLVAYDKKSCVLNKKLFTSIENYITGRYREEPEAPENAPEESSERSATPSESFSDALFRLMEERELTDTALCRRANLDQRVFSKIRKAGYGPSKDAVLALAIALALSPDDASDLLMKAGYAFETSSKQDLIAEYFISRKQFNVFEINNALFVFDQPQLGTEPRE